MFLQNVHRAIPLTTFQRGKIMNAMQTAFNKAQTEKAKQAGNKQAQQQAQRQAQEFVSEEFLQQFREEILETLKFIQANQEASPKQEAPEQEASKQEASPNQEPPKSTETAEDASVKEAAVPALKEEGKKKLKGKTIFKVVASSAALVAVTIGGMTFMKRRADKALAKAADEFVAQNPM